MTDQDRQLAELQRKLVTLEHTVETQRWMLIGVFALLLCLFLIPQILVLVLVVLAIAGAIYAMFWLCSAPWRSPEHSPEATTTSRP